MAQFRKKPVVIEAIQFNGFDGSPDFVGQELALFLETAVICAGKRKLAIYTLEGKMEVSEGDWIIKGIKGEFYPCKPDIFEATYEPVS
jgi:hypothetical protein